MGQYQDKNYNRLSGNYSDVVPGPTTYKEGNDENKRDDRIRTLSRPFIPSEWYARESTDHISLSKIEEIKEKAEMGRLYILSRITPYGAKPDYNPNN